MFYKILSRMKEISSKVIIKPLKCLNIRKSPKVKQTIIKERRSRNSRKTLIGVQRRKDDVSLLTTRIKKAIFRPRHTLVSKGRVYNVCKTCPSYYRKKIRTLK